MGFSFTKKRTIESAQKKEADRTTLSPTERAKRLHELLRGKGKPSFREVADLLATGHLDDVEVDYSPLLTLKADIEECFAASGDERDALLQYFEKDHLGQPGLGGKLLTALKPRNQVTMGDDKGAIQLLEKASPEERQRLKESTLWKERLADGFRHPLPGQTSWKPYATALVDSAQAELAFRKKDDGATSSALVGAKAAELMALLDKHMGGLQPRTQQGALVKEDTLAHVRGWTEHQRATLGETSADRLKGVWWIVEAKLREQIDASHMRQLQAILAPDLALDAAPAIAEFEALFERKGEGGALTSHAKEVETLDRMTAKERHAAAKRRAGRELGSEGDFDKAMPAIGESLHDSLRGPAERRAMLRLRPGAPEGPLGHLDELEDLVFSARGKEVGAEVDTAEPRARDARRDDDIMKALARLDRQDYALVRLHRGLLERIELALGGKESPRWKWAQELLGLLANPAGIPDAVKDPPGARRGHAALVELRSGHWARLLQRELERVPCDPTEILSITRRAWNTAEERRALRPDDESLPASVRKPDDEDLVPGAFLRAVHRRLGEIDPKLTETLAAKVPAAAEALREGSVLDSDVRLEDAKHVKGGTDFINPAKLLPRAFHGKRDPEEIVGAAIDCTGVELLDEWTNVGELRRLRQAAAMATDEKKRAQLQTEADRFVLALSDKINDVISDQHLPGAKQELCARLLERLARALERDDIFVGALQAEQPARTLGELRAIILATASLLAAKTTRHGAQLAPISTKGEQRDQLTSDVRFELGRVLENPGTDAAGQPRVPLEGLAQATEGLTGKTEDFAALKQKVHTYVARAVTVLTSAVTTAASFGVTGPLTAAIGPLAAAFVTSLLTTAPAIIQRELINLGFEGHDFNGRRAAWNALRSGVMGVVTVGAGSASEGGAEAIGSAVRDEIARKFAENVGAISAVEVPLRTVATTALDAVEGQEIDLDAFGYPQLLGGVGKDALSKAVTGLGEPDEGPVSPTEGALTGFIQTMTGQAETVAELDHSPQGILEGYMQGVLERRVDSLSPKDEAGPGEPTALPKKGDPAPPIEAAIRRGYTLRELRALFDLRALMTHYEQQQGDPGWVGTFARAGVIVTDLVATAVTLGAEDRAQLGAALAAEEYADRDIVAGLELFDRLVPPHP